MPTWITAALSFLSGLVGLGNKAADAEKSQQDQAIGMTRQAQADDAAALKAVAAERDAVTKPPAVEDKLGQGTF